MFNRIGSFFLTSKNISLALENNMFNCVYLLSFVLDILYYQSKGQFTRTNICFAYTLYNKKNRFIDGRKVEIRSEIDSKDSTNRKAEPETNQTRKSHSYHRAHLFNNVVT